LHILFFEFLSTESRTKEESGQMGMVSPYWVAHNPAVHLAAAARKPRSGDNLYVKLAEANGIRERKSQGGTGSFSKVFSSFSNPARLVKY
jgi:hypothetical protein